ncbi:MAG: HPr family phosphocarrier protein [Lachnospiraceae bacterium]|nr:HPr family phosphocarrier protein [Lachnospiraceae bacterium]
MIIRNIFLSEVDDVMEFVHQTEKCSYDIDISIGDSVINAKSILGMLSKGVHRMMQVNIHTDQADELLNKIRRFCV